MTCDDADPKAELVIKAQIHAGGRGKGTFKDGFKGGVKVTSKASDIKEFAKRFIGNTLITKQTGPEGQLCQKVLVHEGINFKKEYYFAILMDRSHNGPVLVGSQQGGMDIEEVAHKNPEAIFTVRITYQSASSLAVMLYSLLPPPPPPVPRLLTVPFLLYALCMHDC